MGNNNNPNPDLESAEEAKTERQLRETTSMISSMNKTDTNIARSFNPSTVSIDSVAQDRESWLRNSQNQELGRKNDIYYAYVTSESREPDELEKILYSMKGMKTAENIRFVSVYADGSLTDALPPLDEYDEGSPERIILENMSLEAMYDKESIGELTPGKIVTIRFLDGKNNKEAVIVEVPEISGVAAIANASGVTKGTPLSEVRKNFFNGENPKQDIFDRNARTRDLDGVTEFIIHETTSFTSLGTSRTLLRKGLGVHYLVSETGVLQPTGAWDKVLAHAGGSHNQRSIGVEVVAPFYAEYAQTYSKRVGPYWKNVTNYAPWAHVRSVKDGNVRSITGYIFPTQKQMEATWELTQLLTSADSLKIPMKFLGFEKDNNRFVISGLKHYYKAKGPGIYAHSYFGHSDGAVLVLYCFLRYSGINPKEAYQNCIDLLKKGNLKYAANNYYADLSLLGKKFNV